jgi:pimeloyl-ACP methyl ester carboxylesterase
MGASALMLVACWPDARTGERAGVDARSFDQSVVIPSDSGRVLGGAWRLPDLASTSVAAVLLLSGSGPQDRDGSRADLPGYAPLRELADSLAARGTAVLRLDDRGIGASTGDFLGATTLDFARDAAAAVRWLRAQPMVDPFRVTLVGHSEGALVAMLTAAADSTIRAVVLLGAPSRSGRDVARWQRRAYVAADPTSWPPRERDAVLARADSGAERAAEQDPWLRTWFALEPRTIARHVRAPVLLLHGETDRQVPVAQADELAAAFRAGGTADVTVRRFPSVNHLLLDDADGDPRGYARLGSRALRGDVVRTIGDWIRAH